MVHWILGQVHHIEVGPIQTYENTTTKLIKWPLTPSYIISPWWGGLHSRPRESLQFGFMTKPLYPWWVDCSNIVQTKVSVRRGIFKALAYI